MNYPMQELAIIAPILFVVLMVAFPLIGVFAGWKRAAFWGGGNLLFYIIGLIVWTFAGISIANAISPLLESLMKQLEIKFTPETIASIAAPVFFLIVFLVGNLILLINYYAWFKRTAKLRKADKNPNQLTKNKVINHVVGGVGLPLLMLPSTLTLTQAVFMTTTSPTTRANNPFVEGLYNGITAISDKVNWFSYYSLHGARDFDAVFATITLMSQQVSFTYTDPWGNVTEFNEPGMMVMEKLLTKGLFDISEITKEAAQPETEITDTTVGTTIKNFTDAWRTLNENEQVKAGIESVLSSDNATVLIDKLIEEKMPAFDPVEIPSDEQLFKTYITAFDKYVAGYSEEKQIGGVTIVPIAQINTTQESFDNIEGVVHKLFDTSQLSETQQETIDTKLNTLLKLVLNPVL